MANDFTQDNTQDSTQDAQDGQTAAPSQPSQPSQPAPGPSTTKQQWVPKSGDPISHIETSDGRHLHIHDGDLAEAQRRDPGLKVHGSVPNPVDYDAMLAQVKARQAQTQQAPTSPPNQSPYDAMLAQVKARQTQKAQAAAGTPPLSHEDALSRTLMNMTRAMSGQRMDNPEDQAEAERGKREGFEAAGVTALTTLGGELLAAPKLLQVAARDPATGQFVRGLATKEGPRLITEAISATKAAGEAHPLVRQAIIHGLTLLGAGGVAKALGWLGKAVE